MKFNLCHLSLLFVFYFAVFHGKFSVEAIATVAKKSSDFLGCVARIAGWYKLEDLTSNDLTVKLLTIYE